MDSTISASKSTEYHKYEVSIKRCRIGIGQPVTPETVVGVHYRTGAIIRAGVYGQVATMYFNPMHASFMVLIVGPENSG